ncbi:TorF family putative porin [Colwellia psychrerythraea]|uniref:TIGR02001 family outer membrane protein n=1 Tax=Colwellia psychrerythraea (strain 34H / ATCC BAA-681) TaxID=167879 RepID=Q483L0_COLP3|nr:TorF family putative porin [Colwellia psychrerythraea]AAZ26408.1 hypothetical protein CPS_2028 [Colwellia psychrerythraea 34H]
MKYMKKMISISVLALTTFASQAEELSSTISFTNDYRFRGLSQTAGDAAVQGSIDLAFENGVFVGVWGSNVDFGPTENASLEVDYYVGYGGNINDQITYDATLFYFQYPGYNGVDIDYLELDLGLHYKGISLLYAVSNDWVNSGESAQYLSVDYSYPITEDISLDLHAGYTYGEYWDGIRDFNDYKDYSIGLSGQVYGLDLSAAYIATSMESGDEVDTGAFRNDDTVQLTISRSF